MKTYLNLALVVASAMTFASVSHADDNRLAAHDAQEADSCTFLQTQLTDLQNNFKAARQVFIVSKTKADEEAMMKTVDIISRFVNFDESKLKECGIYPGQN